MGSAPQHKTKPRRVVTGSEDQARTKNRKFADRRDTAMMAPVHHQRNPPHPTPSPKGDIRSTPNTRSRRRISISVITAATAIRLKLCSEPLSGFQRIDGTEIRSSQNTAKSKTQNRMPAIATAFGVFKFARFMTAQQSALQPIPHVTEPDTRIKPVTTG
jgi:hypothetical protein